MALRKYSFVGLKNPVYLPDDIIVELTLIPSDRNYVRSGVWRADSEVKFVTRHETANFKAGADADMHYRWLMSNVGNDPDNASGYNCVSDDKKIIQTGPYNEVTWAAGNAIGNRTSDHHELCVQEGIDHAKARRIAAALDAGVLHARGLPVSSLVQHNYWWGKDCPKLMRANNNAIWNDTYYPMVKKFYAEIVAFVSGKPAPAPAPAFPPAVRIPEADGAEPVVILDNGSVLILSPAIVETIKPTPRLQTAWSGSEKIGADIAAKQQFVVRRLIINTDGSMYWYTPWATRVRYEDTRIVGAA